MNVEKIFNDHFGVLILLSLETPSSHWVPAVIYYSVGVNENVWEDSLAMFFDGNIGFSMQSMRSRIKDCSRKLDLRNLGKLYLDIWRSKWAKNQHRAMSTMGPPKSRIGTLG